MSINSAEARPAPSGRIIISGGGLAGLSMAKSLEKLGYEPIVLEKRKIYAPEGSGIAVPANGSWALEKIGFKLEDFALKIQNMVFMDDQGGVLVDEDITGVHPEGSQFYAIDRTKFLGGLKDSLRTTKIFHDTWIVDVKDNGDFVDVVLNTGKTLKAELLIISEGIHSTTKSKVDKSHTHIYGKSNYVADYLGIKIWRTIIGNFANLKAPLYMLGQDRVFLLYPINDKQLYIYGHVVADRIEQHVQKADYIRELREVFKKFSGHVPRALDEIERLSPEISSHYLETTKNVVWSNGNRILFSGDASRGFSPMLQNGAAQAFEDAYVLGKILKTLGLDKVQSIAAQYQKRREERATWVKEVSDRKIVALTREQVKKKKRNDSCDRSSQCARI